MGVTARDLFVRRGAFTLSVAGFAAGSSGTAVLGPNGAGKTTLLLALQGLLAAEGAVERPVRSAAVFARPAVLRGSALWNVAVIVESTLGIGWDQACERARRMLHEVGLSTRADADARTLSTGERQRLALARAVAIEPAVLFLDEAFANIDADARPALRSFVTDYCARSSCDVVVATSSLADAFALCSVALVLDGGTVTYEGSTQDLQHATGPFVRALFEDAALTGGAASATAP
jgi:ABC-type multidrug transport system ATPase subunit